MRPWNKESTMVICEVWNSGKGDAMLTQAPQCSDEEGSSSRHFQSLLRLAASSNQHQWTINVLRDLYTYLHTETSLPVQNTRTASLAQPLSDTLELTRWFRVPWGILCSPASYAFFLQAYCPGLKFYWTVVLASRNRFTNIFPRRIRATPFAEGNDRCLVDSVSL